MNLARETREGWPLLTFVWNWGERGLKEYKWNGLVGIVVPVQDIFFCRSCSSRPNTKYFFPHRTLFRFLCPHRPASLAGSRAGSPVSLYVSLDFANKGKILVFENKRKSTIAYVLYSTCTYVTYSQPVRKFWKHKTCDILWECNSIRGIISVFIT